MKRKSPLMFFIALILLVFVGISIILFRNFIGLIQNDASTINRLGSVRGSIQRFSKLELAHEDNSEIQNKINYQVEQFLKEDIQSLKVLVQKWQELEGIVGIYRKDPTPKNQELFVQKSEECWTAADQMVLANQYISERKIQYLTLPIILLAFNFAVIFVLLFIVKKYVYDNLEVSVTCDPLTKVFNRRYFMEYLSHEILRANRKDIVFSLIMFDIDHFKKVNDTFGHSVGDEVLAAVASIALKSIRKSDVLSRIGGEEFTILLPDTDIDKAYILSERVRKNIEEYTFKHVNKVTVSLGVSAFKINNTADEIMQRADAALYRAKDGGRNRTEIG